MGQVKIMPKRISPKAAAAICGAMLALSGCSTLGGTGPSTGTLRNSGEESYANEAIQVIDLEAGVINRLTAHSAANSFAEVFGDGAVSKTVIGAGDTLDIAIWEAPPAVLFGSSRAPRGSSSVPETASQTEIPQQQVGEDGRVTVPFVGRIAVLGLRPEQVEAIITSRLAGRANNPQAVVRLVQNETRTVTVLGDVASSGRVALTSRGERLLDVLASAGGSKQAIEQSTVQLARGATLSTMPLSTIIADPDQNVRLRASDVITVQHKPFSFVALGEVRQSAEIPFEGAGINLAEALARAGGLDPRRADVKGVFVFRMEERAAGPEVAQAPQVTADGRVPTVYRLQMNSAASLFAMQDFRMRDGDVLYVSTAPGVDIERFLTLLSNTAFSIAATANSIDQQ
ncbi:MAG: polysaccharide biosynthesis/export family protein [Pseudomonadota bacterium]|nr:polysaccharide biosynthesis/export family protein [Pseudomonadota bacterium]